MFSNFFQSTTFTRLPRKESSMPASSTSVPVREEMVSLFLNLQDAIPPIGINKESLENSENLALSKRDFKNDLTRGIIIKYKLDGGIVESKFLRSDNPEDICQEIDDMCKNGAKVVYRCAQGSKDTPAFGNHFIYGLYYLFSLCGVSLSNYNTAHNQVNMKSTYIRESDKIKFNEEFSYHRIMISKEEADGAVSLEEIEGVVSLYSKQVINSDGTYDKDSSQGLTIALPKKVLDHVKAFIKTKLELDKISVDDKERFQIELFAKALMSKKPSVMDKLSQSFASLSMPSFFKTTSSDIPKVPSVHQIPSAGATQQSISCSRESFESDSPLFSTNEPESTIPCMY